MSPEMIARMVNKIYEMVPEELSGEKFIILASSFEEAIVKAKTLMEKLNADLHEHDQVGSLRLLHGKVDI